MAALIASNFALPNHLADGIFKKAQTDSVLMRLAGATAQKFGTTQQMVLSAAPKAEIVGEGDKKSPTPTAYTYKTVVPIKLQVTMRYSSEVKWADEAYQAGILADMSENAGKALGRALDLVAIHKVNPLTGTVSSMVSEGLIDTALTAEVAGTDYDKAIEAAAGLVIGSGYTPTGIALDPSLSFNLSTQRDKEGRKLYPEIGFGQSLGNLFGMTAAVGDTVSGKNELATASGLLGVVGQFDAIRWGVQETIPVTLIEYGDPDGLGDLQRQNQIALRAEVVYGVGIMDKAAFALIK